eukprot:TRINITY_DN4207_c0_g2_i1.p1 TRINITY_DN4207_c0_g2~~TRINITY_DN4207_c0_g2_i1.p1  ORF type:complete len:704 (-),score=190.32 TRINITY_DN4207_c0_g2_i1:65-1936(-)
MFALPFITEYSGFKGKIYATEPTIQIGRQLMEEMVTLCKLQSSAQNPNQTQASNEPHHHHQLYSHFDVEKCIAKILPLNYGEEINIYSSLRIRPISSGFSLGSANWLLLSEYEKIVYMSDSASANHLARHPEPMEINKMKGCDLLILSKLTNEPSVSPESSLERLLTNLGMTLNSGGNVLMPIHASGFIFDLFEIFHNYLAGVGLSYIPMYFISPLADATLAYSNIVGEWMCKSKQDRIYLPETPFSHPDLIKAGRLLHFPNLHSSNFGHIYKEPCIVFVTHPSLRFGDVLHFIKMWGSDAKNTLIISESEYDYQQAISPFQPMAMKVVYCPINPNLNFLEANQLINELKPKNLLLPAEYYHLQQPQQQQQQQSYRSQFGDASGDQMNVEKDLGGGGGSGGGGSSGGGGGENEGGENPLRTSANFNSFPSGGNPRLTKIVVNPQITSVQTYKSLDVLSLPLQSKFERAFMTPELAMQIQPQSVGKSSSSSSTVAIANVTAVLSSTNNIFQLDVPNKENLSLAMKPKMAAPTIWKHPNDPQLIVKALQEKGIKGVKIIPNEKTSSSVSSASTTTIHISSLNATISLSQNKTSIHAEGGENSATSLSLLKEILLPFVSVYPSKGQ